MPRRGSTLRPFARSAPTSPLAIADSNWNRVPKQSISTLILKMPANSSPTPQLGIPDFTIEDLHDPQGLKRLAEKFDQDLAEHHRSLFDRFDRYRQGQEKLGPV